MAGTFLSAVSVHTVQLQEKYSTDVMVFTWEENDVENYLHSVSVTRTVLRLPNRLSRRARDRLWVSL